MSTTPSKATTPIKFDEDQSASERYFGFNSEKFCDQLFDSQEAYIMAGLDEMEVALAPSFTKEERVEVKACMDTFMDIVATVFDKNLDKFEYYTTNNIFCLPENIAEQVARESTNHALTPGSAKKRRTSTSTVNAPSPKVKIPESATSLPTKEAMASLDQELAALRTKLRMAKRNTSSLKLAQLRLARAVEKTSVSADGVLTAVASGNVEDNTMHETVTACIQGHEGFNQLMTMGGSLVEHFEEGGEGDENVVVKGGAAPAFDKGAITASSARDISNLTNILKK